MDEKLRPARWPRHPSLEVRDGVIQETGEPATLESVEELTAFGEGFLVDVWNCRAYLARVGTRDGVTRTQRVEWSPPLMPRQQHLVDVVLRGEVYGAGGWMTTSGWYRVSQEALDRVARIVGRRRLRVLQARAGE